jgi:hypothetical protein
MKKKNPHRHWIFPGGRPPGRLIEQADTLEQLVGNLDELAVRFGQAGDGETCAALLDLSGVIRDWRDR